jgi:hypothetical protein
MVASELELSIGGHHRRVQRSVGQAVVAGVMMLSIYLNYYPNPVG